MIKTLLFAVCAAAAAATVTASAKPSVLKKGTSCQTEESPAAVIHIAEEPAAEQYDMDYMFV